MRGYRWHRKTGETPCQACKDFVAADRRGRYGQAQGTQPGRQLQPCGTTAAYARHLQHAEEPCQPCKNAHTLDGQAARIVAAMTRQPEA